VCDGWMASWKQVSLVALGRVLEMRWSRRGRARKDYVVSEWCRNWRVIMRCGATGFVVLRVGWRAREVGRDYRW
jgi:hypothetical protein